MRVMKMRMTVWMIHVETTVLASMMVDLNHIATVWTATLDCTAQLIVTTAKMILVFTELAPTMDQQTTRVLVKPDGWVTTVTMMLTTACQIHVATMARVWTVGSTSFLALARRVTRELCATATSTIAPLTHVLT